jgi:signal transduction histidine kinase
MGTLGPWAEVAESGRALFTAAEPAAAEDAALRAALERHREDLTGSVTQARRWSFIGQRLVTLAPLAVLVAALLVAALALAIGRRLARELARPIRDLVGWSERLALGQPLPAANGREHREVVEVRALRSALRDAAERIAESRRRELEAERLRAWGEMARRVAHEMKNPLTPLRLAAQRLSSGGETDEAASIIREETERLEELARHFAALGRPADGVPSEVDIEELLRDLLASDVPPGITSTLSVAPGTSSIQAYYDALLRAFRNLLRNAVEAVTPRGAGGAIELRLSPAGEAGVEVIVADNGDGVPAELAERIFEPDFTRKRGGTGLGLAVVRQTIAAHGGQVTARARPQGGAEFVVRLPAGPPVRTATNHGAT